MKYIAYLGLVCILFILNSKRNINVEAVFIFLEASQCELTLAKTSPI